MSRKKGVRKYNSGKGRLDLTSRENLVEKFISTMMYSGKRSISVGVFERAMTHIAEEQDGDPLEVFQKAVNMLKPVVEVKSRRVGGATYQVPVEVREVRRYTLAFRWLIHAARNRDGRFKSMDEKLSAEILDATKGLGSAFKKKEDSHRMAEANKAFTHYRW